MTYPPGSPGYPSAPADPAQYAAPSTQLVTPEPSPTPARASCRMYLNIAVAVLGLAVYLASFGPLFTVGIDLARSACGTRHRSASAASAGRPGRAAGRRRACCPSRSDDSGGRRGHRGAWRSWLVIAQVVSSPPAVDHRLGRSACCSSSRCCRPSPPSLRCCCDAGIITAPAPKPRYEQQPYGQYGQYRRRYYGSYDGQPPSAPGPDRGPPQQRPGGYPPQYVRRLPAVARRPAAIPALGQQGAASSPGRPTPPTGFPAFGQPQPRRRRAGPQHGADPRTRRSSHSRRPRSNRLLRRRSL